jgi:DNA-binding transcriptional ArsR family regulator
MYAGPYRPGLSYTIEHMNNSSYVLLDTAAVTALAETFRVLGDVTRVRILDAISRSELRVGEIVTLLGLTESAVSHQLRLLRNMRLVRPRRQGKSIYYSLDDQHIVRLFEQGLEHVQESGRGLPRT